MNVKSVVENKEKFEVELTIEVGQEEFEAGLDKAYRKNRGSTRSPGSGRARPPVRSLRGCTALEYSMKMPLRRSIPRHACRPLRRRAWFRCPSPGGNHRSGERGLHL